MLEVQLYDCALTSQWDHGTELLNCGGESHCGRLDLECVHARHCFGPPGKADTVSYKIFTSSRKTSDMTNN